MTISELIKKNKNLIQAQDFNTLFEELQNYPNLKINYITGIRSLLEEAGYDVLNNVKALYKGMYSHDNGLKTFIIPPHIEWLESEVFYADRNLTRVDIKAPIVGIPNGTFKNCTALFDITLPKTIRFIGDEAFKYCSFNQFIVPVGCNDIGDCAFYSCTELENLYLPSTITQLGEQCFAGTKMEVIEYGGSMISFQVKGFKQDNKWRAYSKIKIVKCSDGDLIL